MADKVVGLERLRTFTNLEVERTEATYAKKTELPGIASATKAGIAKFSDDFDVAEDGTVSPYKAMAINSITCTPATAERGSTVADVTLAWGLSKTPTTLTLDGADQDVASKGTTLAGVNLTANKNFALVATDARGAKATKSAGVSFQDKRHFFVAGDLDADDVTDEVINAAAGELATSRAKTFTVTAGDGEHIYYVIPASFGTPKFFVGGFEGGFNLLKTFEHTNASGAKVSYQVWKSTNAGLGATTVEVK